MLHRPSRHDRAGLVPSPFAGRGVTLALALATGTLAALAGCRATDTELVLAVDTDLGVPAELDGVQLTVTGPSGTPVSDLTPVDLTASGAPAFPLTLGMTPAGALAPVTVHVEGRHGGTAIVARDVTTEFVDATTKLLAIPLRLACVGVTCDSAQTCDRGKCVPAAKAGTSLPDWGGAPPARPSDDATPIGGQSVWAWGWQSCATKGDSFSCWGNNDRGQLGIGSTAKVATRREVIGLPTPAELASVSIGENHACACAKNGQAWCWGTNDNGQLGTGDTTSQSSPVPVVGLTDCVQIAAGGFHTCAIKTGGDVSCWGSNNLGQVGATASNTDVTTPTAVANLTAVLDVRAGERFTCARRTNNAVYCWGDNGNGQIGDGSTASQRSTPTRVNLAGTAAAAEVSTGRFFACARFATGHVACWGENAQGQIGAADNPARDPVEIAGIEDATLLALGHHHACALRVGGAMTCWGGNMYGQLGDPSALNIATPFASGVTSIAAAFTHTCARRGKTVLCWGQNILMQVGDGTAVTQNLPVTVAGF